jgi:hypothetical protein
MVPSRPTPAYRRLSAGSEEAGARVPTEALLYPVSWRCTQVTSCEFTFSIGDPGAHVQRVSATTGRVVPLAGGTPHTIRNESYADAVAFVVHAPGGPMERFSRAVAAMAAGGGSPDLQAVPAVAAQHGIELLGPVPTPDLSDPQHARAG